MKVVDGLKYSKDHEWVKVDGNKATVGITDYAQDSLGDIVFVDLPEPGSDVNAGDAPAVVEIEMEQADVPSAEEILTFASIHGNFVSIADRIFRRFEIIIPLDSRLDILKDALLQIVHLDGEDSAKIGLKVYEVEDFVDSLEAMQQKALEDRL